MTDRAFPKFPIYQKLFTTVFWNFNSNPPGRTESGLMAHTQLFSPAHILKITLRLGDIYIYPFQTVEVYNEATFTTLRDIPTYLSRFLWFSITRTLWLLTTGSVLCFWFSLLGFLGLAVCFIGLVSCSHFFSSHFEAKLSTWLWGSSVILVRSLFRIIFWSIYA